mmetsp:Transcript_70992/g.179083  ORF Transcript_70992/g.179083 Transcript_70992/m.179083 type:complete len:220 (+) Transcript_70992:300-959(+)
MQGLATEVGEAVHFAIVFPDGCVQLYTYPLSSSEARLPNETHSTSSDLGGQDSHAIARSERLLGFPPLPAVFWHLVQEGTNTGVGRPLQHQAIRMCLLFHWPVRGTKILHDTCEHPVPHTALLMGVLQHWHLIILDVSACRSTLDEIIRPIQPSVPRMECTVQLAQHLRNSLDLIPDGDQLGLQALAQLDATLCNAGEALADLTHLLADTFQRRSLTCE